MKWIGQHIYDLVSRFRDDVYLEDLSTTTETSVLVVDSTGKVSKSTTLADDIIESEIDTLAGLTNIGATGINTLISSDDVQFYNPVDTGQPTYSFGASDAERFMIQPIYDGGAQTLDYVQFKTFCASAENNKGQFKFLVDEGPVLNIDDDGIDFITGHGISINGTDILTDSSGTATLSNIDALDATTEATIEAAIDTLTGPIEIQKDGVHASSALLIDNNTTGYYALEIDAANTGADVVNISAPSMTGLGGNWLKMSGAIGRGSGIYMDMQMDELTGLVIGSAMHVDLDSSSTTSIQNNIIDVDVDIAGDLGVGQNNIIKGFNLEISDVATGNHSASTSQLTGIDITLANANADPVITYQHGIDIDLSGGDTAYTVGLYTDVLNGGTDIKMVSSDDATDYCTIATGAAGATTIRTEDATVGSTAHFEVAADGNITLDANGRIKLEPKSGSNVLIDGTVQIDAGVVTGVTSLQLLGDTDDTCTITSTTHGATSITTVDTAAAAAHFTVTADGDITLDAAGTVKGTPIHYPFRGYCLGISSGNFQFAEDMTDNQFPVQLNSDYGDTVIANGSLDDLSTWFRSSGIVMPRACTAIDMVGWASCPGTGEVTISLCKITPDRNSNSAEVPIVVATTTFTALNSNDKLEDFSVGDSGGDGTVTIVTSAIAKGDILMPFVSSPDTKTTYFNMTLEVEG